MIKDDINLTGQLSTWGVLVPASTATELQQRLGQGGVRVRAVELSNGDKFIPAEVLNDEAGLYADVFANIDTTEWACVRIEVIQGLLDVETEPTRAPEWQHMASAGTGPQGAEDGWPVGAHVTKDSFMWTSRVPNNVSEPLVDVTSTWARHDGAFVVPDGWQYQTGEEVTEDGGATWFRVTQATSSSPSTSPSHYVEIDGPGGDVVSTAVAPTLATAATLSGRTITITAVLVTGDPTPSLALTTLTLEGSTVSPTTSGAGVWTYDVPDSASPETVAWTVTATNATDTATSSGSKVIPRSFVESDLYTDGSQGFVFDAANTTTTGSVVDGDALATMTDISGTATDVTGSGSEQLVYKTDGTYHWFEFDGVDCRMSGVGGWSPDDPFTILMACSATPESVALPAFVTINPNSTTDFTQRAVGTNGLSLYRTDVRNNRAILDEDITANSVYESRFGPAGSKDSVSIILNNGAEVSSNNQIDPLLDTSTDFVIGRGLTGNAITGKVYAMIVVNKLLEGAERQAAIEWLATKASGITLAAFDSEPAQMAAPQLVGGTQAATLTLGPAPSDGGQQITSYDYIVMDSSQQIIASGTQPASELGQGIDLSPLSAGDYTAIQHATNSVGEGAWSLASTAAAVSASAPAVSLPTVSPTQVFTPDPAQSEVVISQNVNYGFANGTCYQPCVVDLRDFPEFDTVTNATGDRLNYLVYGSQDHLTPAYTYVYCCFGSIRGGEWLTYADALAAGHLANYAESTPATSGDGWIFNHDTANPVSTETAQVWKEGSTWYISYHGHYGTLAQTTQYATSTSPFGPFTNQGEFLQADNESNHQGYARPVEIPPEAEVAGPLASGSAGQFLINTLNNSSGDGYFIAHVANRDLTNAKMLTGTNFYEAEVPTDIDASGTIRVNANLMPGCFFWTGSDFAAIMKAPAYLMEGGLAPNMLDHTREPKVMLHPDDIVLRASDGTINTDGVAGTGYPSIITENEQSYLLVGAGIHVMTMPITINLDAFIEPRVFADHYYEEIDFSDYTSVKDVPSQWQVSDSNGSNFLAPPIQNGRLVLDGDLGIDHSGFDPANTEWARFYADGASTNLSDTSQDYHYGIGSTRVNINEGTPKLTLAKDNSPFFQFDAGFEYFQPSYKAYAMWPAGFEWDITGQTVRPLHGNNGHRVTYDLTSQQATDLGAAQKHPYIKRVSGTSPITVGKMSVRYRGAGHTNNAAPSIADAVTDTAGTKVTVTLNQEALGKYGFVLSVGGTVITTTPSRTDKKTVQLTRDAGAFSPSDEIKLHYVSGGDVRSDPQWVLLPAVSDINVKNEVV